MLGVRCSYQAFSGLSGLSGLGNYRAMGRCLSCRAVALSCGLELVIT